MSNRLQKVAAITIAFCFICSVADAALAPGTVAKMKQESPEKLKVEILSVKEGEATGQRLNVDYQAKVLSVIESKSGVKVGDEITIHSYIRRPGVVPRPGPMSPSLLPANWKGQVYLKSADQGFNLSVFGHSFEQDDK